MPPKKASRKPAPKMKQPAITDMMKLQKRAKIEEEDEEDEKRVKNRKVHPMFTKDGMATQQRVQEVQTKGKKNKKPAKKPAKKRIITLSDSEEESGSPATSPQPVRLELTSKAKPVRQGVEVTANNCNNMFKVNYRQLVEENQRNRERQLTTSEQLDPTPRQSQPSAMKALREMYAIRDAINKTTPPTTTTSDKQHPQQSADGEMISFAQQIKVGIPDLINSDSEDDGTPTPEKGICDKDIINSPNGSFLHNAPLRGTQQATQTQRNTQVEFPRHCSQQKIMDTSNTEDVKALRESSRSNRIQVVRDHVLSSKTARYFDHILDSANIAAAGGLGQNFKKGSNGRNATSTLLKRTYATCLLRRLGVTYDGSESSTTTTTQLGQSVPWSTFYAPTAACDSVAPCEVVATHSPASEVRQWLQQWRCKLFAGETLRVRTTVSLVSNIAVVVAASVCFESINLITKSCITIQSVGRRYLTFKKKTKRKGRPSSSAAAEAARKKREKMIRDSYLCSDDDDEDDGSEESSSTSVHDTSDGALVVCGSAGIGKTAAIYAAAAELGFQVLEISSNRKRTKETLFNEVRDATTSGYVGASKLKPQSQPARSPSPNQSPRTSSPTSPRKGSPSPQRRKRGKAASAPTKEPNRVQQKRQLNLGSYFTISPKVKRNKRSESVDTKAVTTPPPRLLPERVAPVQQADGKDTKKGILILFEGADVVFSDEGSFMSGIRSLVAEAKCPIILTCKSLTPAVRDLCCHEIWFDNECTISESLNQIGSLPNISATAWPGIIPNKDCFGTSTVGLGSSLILQTILLAEGFLISPKMTESLMLTFATDIRAAINTCQIWLQGTAPPAIVSLASGQEYTPLDATETSMTVASLGSLPLPCSAIAQYLLGYGSISGKSLLHGSTDLTNAREPFGTDMIFDNYLRLIKKIEDDDHPVVQYRPPPVAVDVVYESPAKKKTKRCRLARLLDEVSTSSSEENILRTPERSTQESEILFPATAVEVAARNDLLLEGSQTPTVRIEHHASYTDAWMDAIRFSKPSLSSNGSFFNEPLLRCCAAITGQASRNDIWKSSKKKADFELLHNEGIDDSTEEGAWWREDELQMDWLTNTATSLCLKNLVNLDEACLPKSNVSSILNRPILGPEKKSYCEPSLSNCVIISHPGSHIIDLLPCVLRPLMGVLFGNESSSRKKMVPHRLLAIERLIERKDYIEMLYRIYAEATKDSKKHLRLLCRLGEFLNDAEWEQIHHYVKFLGLGNDDSPPLLTT
eukprot:TRINITY_DN9140_c0_g1_i1.p1 TRINITY_DN9140_c0_g1~~TRINITY_DN9140_c0_g1_i1.p1  ORF type:complete len:1261 (+),score=217.21 TRINITY_DN9140_c0_g1_i1:73-3855(+)